MTKPTKRFCSRIKEPDQQVHLVISGPTLYFCNRLPICISISLNEIILNDIILITKTLINYSESDKLFRGGK